MKPGSIDRRNRSRLTLAGLLVAAGGTATVAAGAGLFGDRVRQEPVLPPSLLKWLGEWWVKLALLLLAAALVVVGLRWLLAQLRSERIGDAVLADADDADAPVVRIEAGALTRALVGDVETVPGVESATARLVGTSHRPLVELGVTVDGSHPVSTIRDRVEAWAVGRLRAAMGHDVTVRVDYTVGRTPVRVR